MTEIGFILKGGEVDSLDGGLDLGCCEGGMDEMPGKEGDSIIVLLSAMTSDGERKSGGKVQTKQGHSRVVTKGRW